MGNTQVLILKLEKFLKTNLVLVTGSSGYVGTATVELLYEKGYDVIGFDKKNKKDTRNILRLFLTCLKKPKAIIHLSAKKSVPESINNPISYYANNIFSSLSVGIVSRILNIPVVFASSAAIYNPNNPYAKSKIVEEKILKFLCTRLCILRYFNIVGKTSTIKDDESTNIFSIIGKQPQIKINSTTSTRDYVNIMDIAMANILSIEYLQKNKFLITDIFTGTQVTILEVLDEYKKHGQYIDYIILNKQDISIYPSINNTDILGWKASISFSESIKSETMYR